MNEAVHDTLNLLRQLSDLLAEAIGIVKQLFAMLYDFSSQMMIFWEGRWLDWELSG